jgi:hypothetical protein
MRALPALSGRAVIAGLERAGVEVIRTVPMYRHDCLPAVIIAMPQEMVRPFGIYHPAHFARYCGRRALAVPSSSNFSE